MKALDMLGGAALTVVFVLLTTAAIAADKEAAKDFTGRGLQTGLYFKYGDKWARTPIFTQLPRRVFSKSKVSDTLLRDICKNCDDLKIAPAAARSVNKQTAFQENRWANALYIAVLPHSKVKVGEELSGTTTFEPGSLARVGDVIKEYGKPLEQEAWTDSEFQSWVGLTGNVYWWETVGIARGEDGGITHVLIRE